MKIVFLVNFMIVFTIIVPLLVERIVTSLLWSGSKPGPAVPKEEFGEHGSFLPLTSLAHTRNWADENVVQETISASRRLGRRLRQDLGRPDL